MTRQDRRSKGLIKPSKRSAAEKTKIDRFKGYETQEGLQLVKDTSSTKFDVNLKTLRSCI